MFGDFDHNFELYLICLKKLFEDLKNVARRPRRESKVQS